MQTGSLSLEEAERREKLFSEGIKVCSKCKRELSLDNFTKDCTTKTGYYHVCKECQKAQREARKDKIDAWFDKNKDRVKEQSREYSRIHSKEKHEYNQKNKEYFAQKRREYEEANREKVRQQRRKSRHSLSSRYKKYQRGAVDRGLSFELTLDQFDKITQQPCAYCGDLPEDEFGNKFAGIDRINSENGYYDWNVIPCCFTCNYMKSNMNFLDWWFKIKQIVDHLEKNGLNVNEKVKL